MKLTSVEKDKLKKILSDPVLWAKAFIKVPNSDTGKDEPWIARDYQASMLRDMSLRKVYRCGRRCLPGWVRILDPLTGKLCEVKDLAEKGCASVVTKRSDDTLSICERALVFPNGEKRVYTLVTNTGKEIDATSNHPFYSCGAWKELKDLRVGDKVAVPTALPYFGEMELSNKEIETHINSVSEVKRKEKESDSAICYEMPSIIFSLTKESLCYFLQRLYEIDGSLVEVDEETFEVHLFNDRRPILLSVMHLLLRFGIQSAIKRMDTWELVISNKKSITLFLRTLAPKSMKESARRLPQENDVTTHTELPSITYETIVRIRAIGTYPTYDLTVPYTHNFVVQDFITHNTGKSETMILEGLHKAHTQANKRILYITPYENQVNLIFMRLREIIMASPLVKNEMVRMKRSPYMVEFKNGSAIMGFTTGASSASGGASIRGQRAKLLAPALVIERTNSL